MGPGRNRVHVNAVNHGPNDDSIVISSRHQSSVVKIGRDKQVKWILTTPTDRSDKYKGKILTSVGKDGKTPQMRKQRLRRRLRLDANTTYGPDRRLEDNQRRALPHGLACHDVLARSYKIDRKKMTVDTARNATTTGTAPLPH